jgi:hypothetical protein
MQTISAFTTVAARCQQRAVLSLIRNFRRHAFAALPVRACSGIQCSTFVAGRYEQHKLTDTTIHAAWHFAEAAPKTHRATTTFFVTVKHPN